MTFTLTLSHVLAAILAVAGGSGTLGAIVALGAFHRWIKPAIRAEITTYEGEAATVEARKHGYLGEVNGAAIFADNTAANNWVYNSGTKRLVPAASAVLSASNLPSLSGVATPDFGQRYLLVFNSNSDPGSSKPWGPQTGIYEVVNEKATPQILQRISSFDDDYDIGNTGSFCNVTEGDYAGRIGIYSGRTGDVLDTDRLFFTLAGGGSGGISQGDLDDAVEDLQDNIDGVTAELLSGPGRPLIFEPANFTGGGGPMLAYPVVLPSGYTIADYAKARIKGVILVRTSGGQRIARLSVDNLILMRSALSAWNSTDAAANQYDTGARVVNEGHGWISTVDNNNVEPTVADHTGWTDLGGPMTHVWDQVSSGDVTTIIESGAETYFASDGDMPGFAPYQGVLALEFTPINGQEVRIEFDGTIANIGIN